MTFLFLADLKAMTEAEVKEHIATEYAGSGRYSDPSEADKRAVAKTLEGYDILVAYESVGSWGCDSSSWFLLRKKDDGTYFELSGSHCSCYGFEGQFDLQPAPLEYLKSDKFYLPCGGYDTQEAENKKAVHDFLVALPLFTTIKE